MLRDQVEKWRARIVFNGGEMSVPVEVARDLHAAGILRRRPPIRGKRYVMVELKKGLMQ